MGIKKHSPSIPVQTAARASLNLDYFLDTPLPGGARELGYNIEADFVVAEARRRLGGSDWYAGLRYLRADTRSRFDQGRPEEVPASDLDVTLAGLALVVEYDDRDSIFTPGSGTRLQLQATDFAPRYGSDPSFRLFKAAVNSYASPHRDVVLGGRLDFRGASGDTPFYAVPFIELRGIPYLRYQGERVAVAELEARWNLDGRWSLVGFGGAGRASGKEGDLGSAETRWGAYARVRPRFSAPTYRSFPLQTGSPPAVHKGRLITPGGDRVITPITCWAHCPFSSRTLRSGMFGNVKSKAQPGHAFWTA